MWRGYNPGPHRYLLRWNPPAIRGTPRRWGSVHVFCMAMIVRVHGDVFTGITMLIIPLPSQIRRMMWRYARARMNGWKGLPINQFGRRRNLGEAIIENTGLLVHSCVPAKHNMSTHARSILIRLMLFFTCNTLKCSFSLSFSTC